MPVLLPESFAPSVCFYATLPTFFIPCIEMNILHRISIELYDLSIAQ